MATQKQKFQIFLYFYLEREISENLPRLLADKKNVFYSHTKAEICRNVYIFIMKQ